MSALPELGVSVVVVAALATVTLSGVLVLVVEGEAPLYIAVRLWLPGVSAEVSSEAAPEFRFEVPREAPPS